MIVFAMFTLNVFHPGRLLLPEQAAAKHHFDGNMNMSARNLLSDGYRNKAGDASSLA